VHGNQAALLKVTTAAVLAWVSLLKCEALEWQKKMAPDSPSASSMPGGKPVPVLALRDVRFHHHIGGHADRRLSLRRSSPPASPAVMWQHMVNSVPCRGLYPASGNHFARTVGRCHVRQFGHFRAVENPEEYQVGGFIIEYILAGCYQSLFNALRTDRVKVSVITVQNIVALAA
jgi:hypothetical protein